MNAQIEKHRVLSGIRATGRLHVGNFFGAVRNFVKYQGGGHHCMYFIADYHTLTTLRDPELLRSNVLEVAKDYVAAGLDPEKSTIYLQSDVPQIAELCLLLSMLQPMGELQTIPTFKEKIRKNPNDINHGLFTYPVLMAADILGPKSTLIPVGSDQVPNVELARKLARRFNQRFGETFIIPEMTQDMVRIPGLSGDKMGKSEADDAVDINDDIEVIKEKYLKKGVTDVNRKRLSDPGDPYNGCRSVYPVHEVATPGETETREIANLCMSAGIGCRDCKLRLIDSLEKIIVPFQQKRNELAEKDDEVIEILHEGGKKARAIFSDTVKEVREKMGLRTI